MTRLARVSGINRHHINSSPNSFVGQELTQLIESPTVRPSTFGFASGLLIGSFPNPRQVFNGNNCITCQCLLNNGFTDDMILMRLIASLTPRQPLQNLTASAPRRSCAFRCFCLKRCSGSGISISDSTRRFKLRSCSNVIKEIIRGGGRVYLTCLQALKSLANPPLQLIENGARSQFKHFNWLAFELGSLAVNSNPCTNPDSQIRTQPKFRAQLLIDQILNGGLARSLGLNYNVCIVASSRKRLKGCLYLGDLFRPRVKLAN
jgi:hypothetical protein